VARGIDRVKEPEVRAVLDVSAMLSYAREHVHVGELLTMLGAEDGIAALPTTALLDAYGRVTDDPLATARLDVLTTLPTTAVDPLDALEARATAGVIPLVKGDLARAHAIWSALEHEAYLFTTEPERTPSILDAEDIVVIPKNDA
jgi:hypothetical protein